MNRYCNTSGYFPNNILTWFSLEGFSCLWVSLIYQPNCPGGVYTGLGLLSAHKNSQSQIFVAISPSKQVNNKYYVRVNDIFIIINKAYVCI